MQFVKVHPDFQLPTRSTEGAGALDLYMPMAGLVQEASPYVEPKAHIVPLGFKAKVPDGHVALILPRSGAGAKHGIELRNTVGVIDSDYTGEWAVAVKQKEGKAFGWAAGERLFQFVVVPVAEVVPELVDQLDKTVRGEGGFGSTGK